jgi:hypothetical protein
VDTKAQKGMTPMVFLATASFIGKGDPEYRIRFAFRILRLNYRCMNRLFLAMPMKFVIEASKLIPSRPI